MVKRFPFDHIPSYSIACALPPNLCLCQIHAILVPPAVVEIPDGDPPPRTAEFSHGRVNGREGGRAAWGMGGSPVQIGEPVRGWEALDSMELHGTECNGMERHGTAWGSIELHREALPVPPHFIAFHRVQFPAQPLPMPDSCHSRAFGGDGSSRRRSSSERPNSAMEAGKAGSAGEQRRTLGAVQGRIWRAHGAWGNKELYGGHRIA
jgi:hypothetical protein